MAQPLRARQPLETLQSMLNMVLIETGKAVKIREKDNGRTLASCSTRLRTTIPGATELFQQALDELESEILRAKAILSQDLEGLQAKRRAAESPVNHPFQRTPDVGIVNALPIDLIGSGQESGAMNEGGLDKVTEEDGNTSKGNEVRLSSMPLSSSNDPDQSSVGLGIDTKDTARIPVSSTADTQDTSIDSLFDMPVSGLEDADSSNINLDTMDLPLPDTMSNTPSQEPIQNQTDLELSSLGTQSQGLNTTSLQISTSSTTANKQADPTDDLFALANNATVSNSMDLDLDLGTLGAEDSTFDESFYAGDDGSGPVAELDSQFDNTFFGIED